MEIKTTEEIVYENAFIDTNYGHIEESDIDCDDKDKKWIAVNDLIERINNVLKCARGSLGCRKGFECWACSSRKKLFRGTKLSEKKATVEALRKKSYRRREGEDK